MCLTTTTVAQQQQEHHHDPLRDIQIGMQGLAQAGKDPAMMAQMLQDMQVRIVLCCVGVVPNTPRNMNVNERMSMRERVGFILQRTNTVSMANTIRMATTTTTMTCKHTSYPLTQIHTLISQNPELMAEAKKMMENPEWQKKMKELSNSKEFKDSIKKTQDILKDPNQAAHAEAKAEHMLKVGQEQLTKNAMQNMEDAMASAVSNPEVMQEMQKMLQDPNFTKQMQDMMNDPSFKQYADAMQEMMKDPAKKRKFEAMTESIKASL